MKRAFDWLTETAERRVACAIAMLCMMLYIPFAGNYGAWDPWETHYGEVARQMLERNDFVSQWWPGSPQDRQEFWSKPVLTFWLMAIGLKAFGIQWNPAPASEMAESWRTEWGLRVPLILISLAAIWATWELVRRLAGKRTATITAIVLATGAQWALVTRQAMTDMPFVAPMTIALALAGLALMLPEEEREKELPRKELHVGRFTLSYPAVWAFYGFLLLFLLTVLPQLLIFSVQVTAVLRLGTMNVRIFGVVCMLPYIAAFLVSLWWCARAKNKRQLYLFSAWVLCALATLGKGPAGVALPVIVLALWLICTGRFRDLIFKTEIPRGVLLFIATAFPWYHAMLIRHGMGFWNEFIGDNYVHRAGGRHGDRGTFEYYLQWAGYAMFPWSGIAAVAGVLGFRKLREAGPRAQLAAFALVWFLAELTVMSIVQTKFHHYILPALPALAILCGLFLDEILSRPTRAQAVALLIVAAPITLLCGRDLAAFPPRLLWLFNYDYVNMPGTGRPWPLVSIYGDRYEYGSQIWIFAAAAALATAALGTWAWLAKRDGAEEPDDREARLLSEPESKGPLPRNNTLALFGGFVVLLAAGIALAPWTERGSAPTVPRLLWLAPTALMLPFVGLVWRTLKLHVSASRGLEMATWSLVIVGVVWTGFLVDKLLIELSPHWAQKHVIASYFQKRKGPEEPLIAWQLYWRGENFYTKNAIYSSPNPAERTVFLGDRNTEKLQQYFASHGGRRIFFVVERVRFESLRGLLPAAARASLVPVDETNNKVYLAVATLP